MSYSPVLCRLSRLLTLSGRSPLAQDVANLIDAKRRNCLAPLVNSLNGQIERLRQLAH